MSTSGYSYCRSDMHPNGVCLPDVADGYHVPCGARPDLNDELVNSCGKKKLLLVCFHVIPFMLTTIIKYILSL